MKLTNQQILEIIVNTNEEMAQRMKQMEAISKKMEQEHLKHLSELKNIRFKIEDTEVKESIKRFDASVVNAKKTLNQSQKSYSWVLYCILFCLVGACFFLFTFFYGIKSKQDIISEYHSELQKQNRILSKEDALFVQKLRVWKQQNPKDSQKLFQQIEKVKE